MKKIFIFLSIFLFIPILFIFSDNNANHFFWRIQSKSNTIYLLASVIPFDDFYYPLNELIEYEFKKSDFIVINTEYFGGISLFDFDSVYPVSRDKRYYYENNSIPNLLTPSEYKAYKRKLFNKYSINLDKYKNQKLWNIARAIYYLNFCKTFYPDMNFKITNKMTDEIYTKNFEIYFKNKVKKNQRFIVIETIDDYITYVDSFPFKVQKIYFNYAINQNINNLFKEKNVLKRLSIKGDYNKVEDYYLNKIKNDKEYELLYTIFYRNKNQKILRIIEAYLKENKKYFIILNINFLIGKYGIIKLLNEREYNIEQIKYKDK